MPVLINFFIGIIPLAMYFFIDETSHKKMLSVVFVIISLAVFIVPGNATYKKFLNYYKNGFLFFALCIFIFSYFPVGGWLSVPLVIEHSPDNAQAIVVFASGSTPAGLPGYSGYQRALHGFKLLREKRAPYLYLSSGYSSQRGHAEAKWLASLADMIDADPNSYEILKDKAITTTATEAEYIYGILKDKGISRILVVTSGAHIYRTVATFEKFDIEVLPAPVHDKDSVIYVLNNNLQALKACLHEWLGLVYYRMKGYI